MIEERRIAEAGVNGLLARPAGQASVGGVLAVPMVSGVNAQGRLFATRLAEAGLTTLMWDPYPGVPEEQLGQPGLPRDHDEAAAVDQAPRPEHEADVIAVVDRIVGPVQALYGGKDHVTAPAAFASLQAALQRRSQPTMIHVYPDADHGFLAESRQAEAGNRQASRLAWPQTLAFLRAALLQTELTYEPVRAGGVVATVTS